MIKAWDEGIVGLKGGDEVKIIAPPDFAYGDQSIGDLIPANSTLIFEVKVVKIMKY